MDQEVRKSIVRICFDWKRKNGTEPMVIPGIILSIVDGKATIAADPTFFRKISSCVVKFPNAAGYEDNEFTVVRRSVLDKGNFCIFALSPSEEGYIQPVKFETQPVNNNQQVNVFIFPRESYVTPTSYTEGFIVSKKSERVLIYQCSMHEFGYLGSPLFNLRGDLVGVSYLDKGHLQAWTVEELQNSVLQNHNCILVSNGEPEGAAPIAEAHVEG